MTPKLPSPQLLLAKETALLPIERVSARGRLVRLSLDCGKYQGAKPYYIATYFQTDRRTPQAARYTPFRDRAEWLFARFLKDVTDPAELAGRAEAGR